MVKAAGGLAKEKLDRLSKKAEISHIARDTPRIFGNAFLLIIYIIYLSSSLWV